MFIYSCEWITTRLASCHLSCTLSTTCISACGFASSTNSVKGCRNWAVAVVGLMQRISSVDEIACAFDKSSQSSLCTFKTKALQCVLYRGNPAKFPFSQAPKSCFNSLLPFSLQTPQSGAQSVKKLPLVLGTELNVHFSASSRPTFRLTQPFI
jgi:hypothetical protein